MAGRLQGVDGAKLELQEVVDFLKNPDKYTALGAKIPKVCAHCHSMGPCCQRLCSGGMASNMCLPQQAWLALQQMPAGPVIRCLAKTTRLHKVSFRASSIFQAGGLGLDRLLLCRGACWWAHPEQERLCWPRPLQARLACPSSPAQPQSLWSSSWVWVHRVCVTCLRR